MPSASDQHQHHFLDTAHMQAGFVDTLEATAVSTRVPATRAKRKDAPRATGRSHVGPSSRSSLGLQYVPCARSSRSLLARALGLC